VVRTLFQECDRTENTLKITEVVCNEKKLAKLCVELSEKCLLYRDKRTTNKANKIFFFKIDYGLFFVGCFSSGKSKREIFFTSVSGLSLVSKLPVYQSSPSFSLAGTSITLGLSMIRAVRCPFSTIPIIQAW